MNITATELKANMGKYLLMAGKRDIYITKNGRRIARLTNPQPDRVAMLDSLVGVAGEGGASVTRDALKRERLENQ